MSRVTVAIPVRDGGSLLGRTFAALAEQTVPHELLVCDSGSRDGSPALARRHGARVIEITPERFSHGGTRNLLMRESLGAHVAFLTQDSEPADEHWLERLLSGFALASDVGLVYGPYVPRPDAPVPVRFELERWFASLSPDRAPRVDRLAAADSSKSVGLGVEGASDVSSLRAGRARATSPRATPAIELIGPRGFCTDANACLSRAAWEQIPFREVAYAEDRVLAIDMLRAGYAKAYVPDAPVVHSHAYTPAQELKRCFDEWRGLREVYGFREPASPVHLARRLRGELGAARRQLEREDLSARERTAALGAVAARQAVRLAGALLGSRADRLPAATRRRLSLESRASFEPLELDVLAPGIGPSKAF
ncbi:MAG TPA: glycosyltransferase family 2 protein [Solirubrobacteraceae bacterium]|nr:glycosyltransferase family 2 protein [Solirubrobacteraceae bacterium]